MSDLKEARLTEGTRLRNSLGAEQTITGLAAPRECIGVVYTIKGDMFSPLRFATREGLEEAGYEVVTDA